MPQKQKGILLMILSAFLLSVMSVAIRCINEIPVMEQMFFRNLFNALVAWVILRKTGGSFFGPRRYQLLLFLRSIFGFFAVSASFYASGHANQGDVAILLKTSPFWVTILAMVFLKEKLLPVQIPALILAFAGAVLVARPGFNSNVLPLLMAFLSAVATGVAYTLLSYFKGKVDTMTITMYFSTFCMLAAFPLMLFNGFILPDLRQWLFLLLISASGSFGLILVTYAYQMAPAAEISIYDYSGILFSILLGWAALGEQIPATSLLGGALVTGGSVIVYLYTNRRSRESAAQHNAPSEKAE